MYNKLLTVFRRTIRNQPFPFLFWDLPLIMPIFELSIFCNILQTERTPCHFVWRFGYDIITLSYAYNDNFCDNGILKRYEFQCRLQLLEWSKFNCVGFHISFLHLGNHHCLISCSHFETSLITTPTFSEVLSNLNESINLTELEIRHTK